MFVPPVQAHVDVIVFDEFSEEHVEALNDEYHDGQHQNEKGDEKNSKDHHHCTMLGFSSALITPLFTYFSIEIPQIKKTIFFNQTHYVSSYLDDLFQPPQSY